MSVIRPAAPRDVPAILQMIHDLALYEKEPDAVRNTTEMLIEVLFGDHPKVFATMAENSAGEVRGFALWFLNYSTWEGVHGIYLEDLYVRPEAAARATGRHCCSTWRRPPLTGATRASNGVSWTGTSPPSTSTRSSAPCRWRNGPPSVSPERR